jgi:hypothetical protein
MRIFTRLREDFDIRCVRFGDDVFRTDGHE